VLSDLGGRGREGGRGRVVRCGLAFCLKLQSSNQKAFLETHWKPMKTGCGITSLLASQSLQAKFQLPVYAMTQKLPGVQVNSH
jgi:hypothetical protein